MIHQLVELLLQFVHIILHLDLFLNAWIQAFGPGIYLILFLIIFCETGLIVTPFLPGDSLLFAVGALTAVEDAYLSLPLLLVLLISAAALGDAVNYSVGRFVGAKLFTNPKSKIFRKDYLEKTQEFYKKHGGKTVIFGRYIPIIRTFAPFVTGMSKMEYPRFLAFMIPANISWISIFLVAGHFFGNQPYVKNNFHIVIFAIIVISFLPVAMEVAKAKKRTRVSA